MTIPGMAQHIEPDDYGAAVQHVEIDYVPRDWQWALHDSCEVFRFCTCVVHRRAGKTIGGLHELVRRALQSDGEFRGAYIAPTLVQATRIAWKPLGEIMKQIPGTNVYKTERRWTLPNGAEILVLGVDHFDSNRGIGLDYVVLDETALFPYDAWDSVIRPTLSDRMGGALFIGTLDEGGILLDDLDSYARSGEDPAWHALSFDVYQTNVIPPEEIASLKKTMSEEAFAREFECKKVGARGAYWSRLIHEAELDHRVAPVEPDRQVPVNIVGDLGINDDTALWWWQQIGTQVRVLDSYSNSGEAARFYYDVIEQRMKDGDYKLGTLHLPHDGKRRELGTGLSVADQFRKLGLNVRQVPNIPFVRGVEAVRQLIPRCWFDREKTAEGRKALYSYRRGFNQSTGVLRDSPVHDWSSHYADGFRYLAVAIGQPEPRTPLRVRPRARGFMAR